MDSMQPDDGVDPAEVEQRRWTDEMDARDSEARWQALAEAAKRVHYLSEGLALPYELGLALVALRAAREACR